MKAVTRFLNLIAVRLTVFAIFFVLLIAGRIYATPFWLYDLDRPAFYPASGTKIEGIFPVDDGFRIGLVWTEHRPDVKKSVVCYQIVEHNGRPAFDEPVIINDTNFPIRSTVSALDRAGNLFTAWVYFPPNDTDRIYIAAQKFVNDGEAVWGVPTNTVADFQRHYSWALSSGMSWNLKVIPDELGGLRVITNDGIAAFDSDGQPRDDWEGWDDFVAPDWYYQATVADGIGGLWLNLSYGSNQVHRHEMNRILAGGTRQWEVNQISDSLSSPLGLTSRSSTGLGYGGGLIFVVNHQNRMKIAILDSLYCYVEDRPLSPFLPEGIVTGYHAPCWIAEDTVAYIYKRSEANRS